MDLVSFPEDEARTPAIVLGSQKNHAKLPHAIVYFHTEERKFGGSCYRDGVFYMHFKIEMMPVLVDLLRSGQPLEVYYKRQGKDEWCGVCLKNSIEL